MYSGRCCCYGIIRRTLLSDRSRERYGDAATSLALVISLIWMVHPLQTESVTYVVQRAESLMGLFYLLTVYCALRGFQSARPAIWYALAVLSCAFGMGTKEIMMTAPVAVLLYDWMYVSKSLRAAWRQRRWLYIGLATT